MQIGDGILTGMGISFFGTGAEGNLLLRGLMHIFGPYAALMATKTLAIGVVIGLCFMSAKVRWLPTAFRLIIGVYLCAAILPWSYILLKASGLI